MKEHLFCDQVHLDPQTECFCRHVSNKTDCASENTVLEYHYHTYYELFLVFKGSVKHIVKGNMQLLEQGTLIFIRDFDRHIIANLSSDYYEAVNFAFSKKTFRSMAEFLGNGFEAENLLSAEFPPFVKLSDEDTQKLAYDLMALNQFTDKSQLRFQARALLTRIISSCFFEYAEPPHAIPSWLSVTCERMKSPQNFIAGAKHMYEISGKSREHLTRCMQQYYHTTPTAYVSKLRLKHAAGLLLGSRLHVTDICYECGFENLSWFYKSFANEYGMTPREYRRKYQNEAILYSEL